MSRSTAPLDKYFKDKKIPDHVKKSDIRSIKEWLKKQNHLPEITDRQIAIFLHSCYCALELTKNTIDSYYSIRTHAPELFSGRNPKEFAEATKVVYMSILPELSPERDHLIIAGLSDENAENFSTAKTLRFALSILDIEGHLTPFGAGWRLVISAKGFSLGHFVRLTANFGIIKEIIYYVQDGLPLRLKGIHIFNAIPLVNQFLAVMRPVMKKELYDMISIHSNNDIQSLYKYIPQECFPSNFGGKAPSVQELTKVSNQKMEEYKQWFADDDKLGRVDESKRAGKAKNAGDIFGIDGSFKKLDFD